MKNNFYVGQIVMSKETGRTGKVIGCDKKNTNNYFVKSNDRIYSVCESGLSEIHARPFDDIKINDTVYCHGLKKQGKVTSEDELYKDFFKIDFDGTIYTFNKTTLEKIKVD